METAVVEVYEPNRSTLRLELTATLVVGRDCEGLILTDPLLSRRHVELRPAGGGRSH